MWGNIMVGVNRFTTNLLGSIAAPVLEIVYV